MPQRKRRREREQQKKPSIRERVSGRGRKVPKQIDRPGDLPSSICTEFPKFSDLPTELRRQIWEHASASPRMYFIKLLWVEHCTFPDEQFPREEYLGHYHVSTRGGHPILARATFPRFERLCGRLCPLENSSSLRMHHSYKPPERWWNQVRPARAPSYYPVAVLHACKEAREIYLRERHGLSVPVLRRILDETEESDYNMRCGSGTIFMRSKEPLELLKPSWPLLSLNPRSDLICLQVDITPSVPKPPLWKVYPEFKKLEQLAVEFHGPTTRDWCPSCAERRHPPGERRRYVVHRLDCLERIRGGCHSSFSNLGSLSEILISQFPAVKVVYLVDWGMRPLADVQPDRSTLRFACAEYDFFEVQREQSEGQWDMKPTDERPCPFESLDCAEEVERAIPKQWDRQRELLANGVDCLLPDCWAEEKYIRCRVLAAVPRTFEREYQGPPR